MVNNTWLSFLETDELEVEFLVRGIPPHKPNSVSRLANVFMDEETGKIVRQVDCHAVEPQKEFDAICKYASSISSQMDMLKDNLPINDLRKLFMKSFHWDQRALRFKNTFGTSINIIPNQNKIHRLFKYLSEHLKIQEELINKSEKHSAIAQSSGSVLDLEVSTINQGITLKETCSDASNPISNMSPLNGINDNQSGIENPPLIPRRSSNPFLSEIPSDLHVPFLTEGNQSSLRVPMPLMNSYRPFYPKWKIQFKGTPSGINVNDFIFQLEFMARTDCIPSVKLVNYVHLFVSEVAEQWLWVFLRHNPYPTWPQLKVALVKRFNSEESEDETRRLIEHRCQKTNESFNQFVLEIQTMNGRLINKFDETSLLKILRKNMSLSLRNFTLQTVFDSVEHLRSTCQKYETMWEQNLKESRSHSSMSRSRQLNEINLSQDDLVDPWYGMSNLSLGEDQASNTAAEEGANVSEVQVLNFGCYNCKAKEHRFFDCPTPITRIFCFGCGEEGILKPNCSRCVKRNQDRSGNRSSNVMHPGNQRSNNPFNPRTITNNLPNPK